MARFPNNALFNSNTVTDISRRKVNELLDEQIKVFDNAYISRSGNTRAGLFAMKTNTRISSTGFTLEYPAAAQFLDLKYATNRITGSRVQKNAHAFMYRRYIYGHTLF